MPNIKSAKKRVKVIATKTARNKNYKSSLKTAIKKANTDISSHAEGRGVTVRLAISHIDKAVSKGIIHKKTAARKKSALARKLNQETA